ncbi:MAG: dimethyl sulfoxide reductase anchor subunit [Chloroflexi bacterium]|nr:dimethyl sulfoxide reductase anchor subunit [Chloroflexota bacterium]
MELVPAQKQRVWKTPAVVNFSLGGIGAGFYFLALFVNLPGDGNWLPALLSSNAAWLPMAFLAALFKLLGVALAGLGFIALTTEAGRPQRGINLFRHLRRSWMSRETLAFFLFVAFAGLDWLVPNPLLRALAALAALFLMLAQGFILYRARGVTAWNTSLMPLYFLTAGLMTGAGLLLVLFPLVNLFTPLTSSLSFAAAGILTAILNLALWLIYLRTPDAAFQNAVAALRAPNPFWQIVGIGHLLPALLLAFAWANPAAPLSAVLEIVAGGLLLFGGVRQKWGIILQAGYLRAITLATPHLPRALGRIPN